jgi:hypothetical protein
MPEQVTPPLPVDARLFHAHGGYGWVYRRRVAIVQAADREAAESLPPDATLWDAMGACLRVMDRYELPPYPMDGGYWWYRLRDLLGLTRRPL